MTRTEKWKTPLALLFVLLLALGFLRSGPRGMLRLGAAYLAQGPAGLDAPDALRPESLEDELSAALWRRQDLLTLNGWMMKRLNMRGYYGDIGIYIAEGDYLVSAYPETSTDYELEQLVGFRDFLAGHGIRLLYVNKPGKYLDDALTLDSFGVESFSNRNADRLLARLREAGIPTLDLRACLREEGLEIRDLFYRTDHHWTTRAALWGARHIAEALNESCGWTLDLSLWDGERFIARDWTACWLGEQGRKLGAGCVGLDDYTELLPAYETRYLFKLPDGEREGDFGGFVDETVFNTENSVYDNPSWHYAYNRYDSVNLLDGEGKLLLLGDSFDQVTVPFLSLGVHELDSLVLRYYGEDFDLRRHILDGGYDTVVVCYAPLMIGAHDDPTSFNYRMFRFA